MTPPAVSNAVLAERLSNIEKFMAELRDTLKEIAERLSQVEKREISCQAVSSGRIESAHARLDRVEEKVKDLEKIATDLVMTNRILKWMLGIITAIAVAILIALIRGDLLLVAK
jgi:t-SNARE complex subunit (syntaxin)